jgi:mRNA interferase RelE/StbE
MSYKLLIQRHAQKELSQLAQQEYGHVVAAIRLLNEDPRPHGCRKLSARDGWRIRVGDYRVIYEVDDMRQIVTVLHVGHRRDIYR